MLILRVLLGHAARTDTFFIGVAAFAYSQREREREEERGSERKRERERTGSMIVYR